MDGKHYLCIIKNTDTMTQQVDTHRELLFIVSEVDETMDPINIVNRIYMSYEGGVIDETHRDLLLGTLYRNCMKYGVEEWRNAQENDLPF